LTSERWAQIEELFHRAAQCGPEHRTRLLDEACIHDPDLRSEVEALLSSESSAREWVQAAVQSGLKDFEFPLAGEIVSHYRIQDGLGGGGMGLVYRAEDIRLGRRVALKFLPGESAKDPAALQRFEREARSASALEHPNICPIYEFGEHEGQPFIVMQLLEGRTLRELIAAGPSEQAPLQPGRLLDLAIQIADGLDAAHRQGIIHRDIKPANIFVTSQEQAKILDFGLAKLARDAAAATVNSDNELRDDAGTQGTALETARSSTPGLFLSRTATAMGTLAYMSPEQIRGEKLDARTDLFSFGLVLYEMATGHRAFEGGIEPDLQEAILKQEPIPARQLNPKLPVKLQKIIDLALQNDREARYGTAADMRADLENVKRAIESKRSVRWLGLVSAAALATAFLFVGTIFWTVKRRPAFQKPQPEPKLQQLTNNSFENRVLNGAISPDGKYLAYADVNGMHIKRIATGDIESVPQPPLLKGKNLDWEINSTAWFPDSTGFVASARPPVAFGSASNSVGASIWYVSVRGEVPKKLRDNAVAYSISPDGSRVSFGSNPGKVGDREIWLMRPDGDQAQELYEVGEDRTISGLIWTPDGQRVLYFQSDGAADGSTDRVVSRDLSGGPVSTVLPPSKLKEMEDLSFLPDGRLIYAVKDPPISDTCNYWVTRIDPRTGQTIEQTRKLTHETGFCMNSAGATADGKRFAFVQWKPHLTSYVAQLASGATRLLQLRHFPLNDTMDGISDWTADSKTIILYANRTGRFGIYKQSLDADNAKALVTKGYGGMPLVTPDGKWILYLGSAKTPGYSPTEPLPLMRVAINGGPSERLLTARPWAFITCSRSASGMCVLAEPNDNSKQAIITVLDPLKGRGAEVVRFPLDPNHNDWWVDISPDGTRLATMKTPISPIEILSLRGRPTQQIKVKGWSNFSAYRWAADGRSMFVVSRLGGRSTLLHVDLQGNSQILWEGSTSVQTEAIPSRDGRRLAISNWTTDGNIWMMENFD